MFQNNDIKHQMMYFYIVKHKSLMQFLTSGNHCTVFKLLNGFCIYNKDIKSNKWSYIIVSKFSIFMRSSYCVSSCECCIDKTL